MLFTETKLSGVYRLDLQPNTDERGAFARSFCEREFAEHGLPIRFPQCNLSINPRAGTLRGMHYEEPPSSESKVIRCVRGAIFDVVVDLRPSSPTYLEWTAEELTTENGRALFVPPSCGHGFVTLTEGTDVLYQMGDFYSPGRARGFRWNDPLVGIHWPRLPAVIGARDADYPDLDPGKLSV